MSGKISRFFGQKVTQEVRLVKITEKQKIKPMVVFICILATLAGLLFGLDIGVISGALPLMTKLFHLSTVQQEWVVSTMMVGAALATLASGPTSRIVGRKRCLLVAALLFCFGSSLVAAAWNYNSIIVGRFVMGLGLGVTTYVAPLYLSEITPKQIRGAIVSAYQMMIALGILIVFLSNTAFSYSGNWRGMLLVVAIPALVFLIGVLFLPFSPRWLVMRGRIDEARAALRRVRSNIEEIEDEIQDIIKQLALKHDGFGLFKTNKNFRRTFFLGIILQILQQFSGINVMMYYSPHIFKEIGFASTSGQMWGTVIVGAVMTITTFIAVAFVDKWGRRPMLFAGFAIMGIALAIVGTVLSLSHLTVIYQVIAVLMLLIFIGGFSISAGPLIWLLCSEIQPLKGREFGITASTVTCHISGMIVSATFLSLLNFCGGAHTFYLYAVLNLVALAIIFQFVPETKGISLEAIEHNLMEGRALRHIGR